MAEITAIRKALADKLAAFYSVETPGEPTWTVSPRILAQPDVPALVVMKGPTEYGEAMGYGSSALTLLIVAYVSQGASDESQDLLDELLSPTGDRSLYQVVMAPDKNSQVTLDDTCGDLLITKDSGHRLYHIGGVDYLGADWEVRVFA